MRRGRKPGEVPCFGCMVFVLSLSAGLAARPLSASFSSTVAYRVNCRTCVCVSCVGIASCARRFGGVRGRPAGREAASQIWLHPFTPCTQTTSSTHTASLSACISRGAGQEGVDGGAPWACRACMAELLTATPIFENSAPTHSSTHPAHAQSQPGHATGHQQCLLAFMQIHVKLPSVRGRVCVVWKTGEGGRKVLGRISPADVPSMYAPTPSPLYDTYSYRARSSRWTWNGTI